MQRIERLAAIYPQLIRSMGRLRSLVHEGMDLSYNQYKTLLTIADRQECSLGDLAADLEVAMSSASQMVNRLVGRGLVTRELAADNRRQVVISLSPAGCRFIEDLQKELIRSYERVLGRLDEADQESLVRSLETVTRILETLPTRVKGDG